ncbi:MAG: sigma-54-dependent Fis family transcriptional regulator [Bacteroidetes bacterium]|nr:sigma-54-dependent Fis family transcriptional regulator [Bacteroidota bacterium]
MSTFHILVADDEEAQRNAIAGFLKKKNFTVSEAANGTAAVAHVRANPVDLVLTDFRMPDMTGQQVLRAVREINPDIPVVVITAFGSIETAVGIMKDGAFDYLQKPVELEELLLIIGRARDHRMLISENRLLRAQLAERYSFDNIVSRSGAMEDVLNTAGRVASSKASVLLRGESGTGKELIARAIHMSSGRKDQPFVVVNCAALPESLFESELFGHEKGAFTGAERQRIGKFEQADGGTLFIDEVGDIPLSIQVKLLRALQFGQIERVGGSETLQLDVRFVAATNRDLETMITDGSFREDLYYRLNVVSIHLPPLRKRREDIAPLVTAFIHKYAERNGKQVQGISREAMDLLTRYDYPGNVRELENIVQRAVVLTRDETVTTQDLPPDLLHTGSTAELPAHELFELGDLSQRVNALEHLLIEKALNKSGGNQVKAAELLGISERTLRYKLARKRAAQ